MTESVHNVSLDPANTTQPNSSLGSSGAQAWHGKQGTRLPSGVERLAPQNWMKFPPAIWPPVAAGSTTQGQTVNPSFLSAQFNNFDNSIINPLAFNPWQNPPSLSESPHDNQSDEQGLVPASSIGFAEHSTSFSSCGTSESRHKVYELSCFRNESLNLPEAHIQLGENVINDIVGSSQIIEAIGEETVTAEQAPKAPNQAAAAIGSRDGKRKRESKTNTSCGPSKRIQCNPFKETSQTKRRSCLRCHLQKGKVSQIISV